MQSDSKQPNCSAQSRPTVLSVIYFLLDHWAPYLAAACGLVAGASFAAASQVWQVPVARGLYLQFAMWSAIFAWMWVAAASITANAKLFGEDFKNASPAFRIAGWVILFGFLVISAYQAWSAFGVVRAFMICGSGGQPEFCATAQADAAFAVRLQRFISTGRPD